MKSFFRFTAGEWAASALIGLLLLAGILFYFLYENDAVAHTDTTEDQELSCEYEKEQQRHGQNTPSLFVPEPKNLR